MEEFTTDSNNNKKLIENYPNSRLKYFVRLFLYHENIYTWLSQLELNIFQEYYIKYNDQFKILKVDLTYNNCCLVKKFIDQNYECNFLCNDFKLIDIKFYKYCMQIENEASIKLLRHMRKMLNLYNEYLRIKIQTNDIEPENIIIYKDKLIIYREINRQITEYLNTKCTVM